MGIGAGYGGSLKGSGGFNQSAFGRASQTAGQNIKQGLNYSPTLPQHESGGSQGYTRSVLSEGNITIGDQATSARALGIQTDLQNAHRSAEAVPDLQNLLDKQQTVAQSTAVIHSAVATYSGNRAKAAAEELEKQQAAYEGRLKEQNDGSYEQYAGKSDSERLSMRLGNAKYAQAYQEARSWGVGGSKSRALSAAETLITGALGGQGDLQLAANTLAPYAAAAIGKRFGHGENKNEAAQAIGHFMLGAALAYANGADPLAGGSAAVAAERAAEYLAKQYDDGRTAIDPITGKFNPNLLPEHIKEEIKAQTGAIASVVGAAGGSLKAGSKSSTNGANTNALFNAQVGGVLGQNAVENNYLTREELNAQVDAAVACRKGDKAACAEQKRLERLNKERDLRLLAECNANIRSPLCTRLRKEAEVAMSVLSATPLSRLFDFKMAFNPERRQAHSEEFGKTDTVVLMSYGKSPEEIAANAKMMRIGSELLTDMTVVGTIKDFKQADTFRDYAVATIFAIPGVKVAKKLETVRDFRKAYEAAKEAGDLRTAKKLFELAKDAKGSPRRFEQLEVKVSKIQEELARLEIDFAKIPKEFQKASWNPQRFSLADNQFGHKVGRHATEHGFDMKTSSGRESFKKFIYEIAKRPDELRVGTFNGQGTRQGANHARGSVLFRIKGNNVVVTSPEGEFITILKNGLTSPSVKKGIRVNK